MNPTISIITVVYNGGATLQQCIESVVNQTVKAEHIIVDGASTDSTLDIIQQYDDHIAKSISEKDNGIYDAMNKGLKMASGDVVGILNADDIYASNSTLEKVINVFTDPEIECCYGDLIYVDAENMDKVDRYWKSGKYGSGKFYAGWMPPHPTFFVRRSVYEKYGMFRADLGTAADYEIMLRFLLKHKIKVKYIPEVLVHMRSGGASNVTFSNRIKANLMDRQAWVANNIKPYPWTLWLKPLRKIGQWIKKK